MTDKRKRNHYMAQGGPKMWAMYAFLFLFFIKICFMTKKTGVAGIGYFAMAFSVFMLLYFMNGTLIPDIMRKMVLFQVNRRSVRNAVRLYRVISYFSTILSGICSLVMIILSDRISALLFRTPLLSLPIKIFGIALFCMVPQQCMKGYLEGISSQIPGIVSMFILLFIDLVTTFILQNSCMEYGNQVAALMRNQNYYYAYACVSGAIGLAVGSIFSFLFLLLITTLLKQMQKERLQLDETKNSLRTSDILRNYLTNGAKEILLNCFLPLLFFITCIMLSRSESVSMEGAGMMFISMFAAVPVLMHGSCQGKFACKQIHSILRKGDYSHARQQIALHLKTMLYSALFVVVFCIFAAKSFCHLFFDVTTDEMLAVFRTAEIAFLLLTIAVMILCIASSYCKNAFMSIVCLCGILVFPVFATVFRNASLDGVRPYVSALLVSGLFMALIGGVVMLQKSHYRDDLIRVFILPCIGGVVVMLVCLIADKIFYQKFGAMTTFLLSLLLSYISYQFVIILTRTFDRHEWNAMPFGNVPVYLAKKLNMY